MRPASDVITFADTGGEKPETLAHLHKMNRVQASTHMVCGQEIPFITGRCVFKPAPDAQELVEIAHGIDRRATFPSTRILLAGCPAITPMDARLFQPDRWGSPLRLPLQTPMEHWRKH